MKGSEKGEAFLEFLGQYHPDGKVPDELKEEVFYTIDFIELTADVLELFIERFIDTSFDFLEDREPM